MTSFMEPRRQPLVRPGFDLVMEHEHDSKALLPLSPLRRMRRCHSHGDFVRYELEEALECQKDGQGCTVQVCMVQGLKEQKNKLHAPCCGQAMEFVGLVSKPCVDDNNSVCSVSTTSSEGSQAKSAFSKLLERLGADERSSHLPADAIKADVRALPLPSGAIGTDVNSSQLRACAIGADVRSSQLPKSPTPTHNSERVDPAKKSAATVATGDVTTLMLRILPPTLSQQDLLWIINSVGFAKKYDFLYAPRDFGSGRGKGYAFVNFVSSELARRFSYTFRSGLPIDGYKVRVNISEADVQGLKANLAKLNTPSLRRIKNPDWKPFVVLTQSSEMTSPVGSEKGSATLSEPDCF